MPFVSEPVIAIQKSHRLTFTLKFRTMNLLAAGGVGLTTPKGVDCVALAPASTF